jgi:DNA-directed RNA polymerase specialized sigma24 family protein
MEAMQLLTEREQTAIKLRVFEDRDAVDAATLMGCEPATVRSLTRNGVARLRVIMKGADDDGLS